MPRLNVELTVKKVQGLKMSGPNVPYSRGAFLCSSKKSCKLLSLTPAKNLTGQSSNFQVPDEARSPKIAALVINPPSNETLVSFQFQLTLLQSLSLLLALRWWKDA